MKKLFKVMWFDNEATEGDPEIFLGITYADTEAAALKKICEKINKGEARGCPESYKCNAKNLVLSAEVKQEERVVRDHDGRKATKIHSYIAIHASFDVEDDYDVTKNGHHEEEFTTIEVYEIELLENQS